MPKMVQDTASPGPSLQLSQTGVRLSRPAPVQQEGGVGPLPDLFPRLQVGDSPWRRHSPPSRIMAFPGAAIC